MKTKTFISVLFITIFLISCTSKTSIATKIPVLQNESAPASTPALINESPATDEPADQTQLEKWKNYESALALEILQTSDAICEWEILGQDSSKVYVWAICQANNPEPGATAASGTPAVIQLGQDSNIEKVQIPGEDVNIREMLPPEIQEKISAQVPNTEKMWSHLEARRQRPEPPLIVLSGVPLP